MTYVSQNNYLHEQLVLTIISQLSKKLIITLNLPRQELMVLLILWGKSLGTNYVNNCNPLNLKQ